VGSLPEIDEKTGRKDNCQLFDPSESNKKKRDCCGCHQNYHILPPELRPESALPQTPVRLVAAASRSPIRRSPRILKREPDEGLGLSPSKRQKERDSDQDNEVEVKVGSRPIAAGKGKHKTEAGPSKEAAHPPAKLQKHWDALVKDFPHADYGSYELFQNEQKVWMVKCELCITKKPGGYDTGYNHSLSNFRKQHFETSLHKGKLREWKEGQAKAEQKAEALKEEIRLKREELISNWADKGEQASSAQQGNARMNNYLCSVTIAASPPDVYSALYRNACQRAPASDLQMKLPIFFSGPAPSPGYRQCSSAIDAFYLGSHLRVRMHTGHHHMVQLANWI
jgi:hypothetical protein